MAMGTATMTASSGRSREGKQRSEGEGGPESEGEVRGGRGGAWRRRRRPGRRGGSQAGKEELARLACAPGTQLLRGEGRKTTEGLQWWAGPILLGHQVGGPQVSVR